MERKDYCWQEKNKAQDRGESWAHIPAQLEGSGIAGFQSIHSGKQLSGVHVISPQGRWWLIPFMGKVTVKTLSRKTLLRNYVPQKGEGKLKTKSWEVPRPRMGEEKEVPVLRLKMLWCFRKDTRFSKEWVSTRSYEQPKRRKLPKGHGFSWKHVLNHWWSSLKA